MCGVGFVISNEKKLISEFCDKINKSQINRGPDHQNSFLLGNLGICHQRLSIIGLDNKFNQPYKENKLIISFNGEIYNYKFLSSKYNLSEEASASDTACLIELIDLLGLEKTLSIIDGMYSMGIFDQKKRKIKFATDSFGIKQLYYYESKNLILVASTIKALLDCLKSQKIKLDIDPNTINWQRSFNGTSPENTHIKQIKQFRTSKIYEIDLSATKSIFKIDSYFKINDDFIKEENKILERNLFEASEADVAKGLLLSGGVDSTCLLCNVSKENNLETFIIDNKVIENLGFSSEEINNAKRYSDSMGIKKNIIDEDKINSQDLKNLFQIIDIPSEVTGALALYLICKEIKKKKPDTKVLLSGVGADEIFFGYRGHALSVFISILPELFNKLIYELINKIIKIIPNKFQSLRRRLSVVKEVVNTNKEYKDAALHSFTKLNKSSLKQWRNAYPLKQTDENKFNTPKLYYQRCFDYFLAQQHLPSYDRVSMFFSIELRVPFLQKRIKKSNQIYSYFNLIFKSIIKKRKLKKIINKKLNTKYLSITKSGFGTYPVMFSNSAFKYINELIKYGNKKKWIKEKLNSKSTMDLRLFFHLINKAHYVFLLKNLTGK